MVMFMIALNVCCHRPFIELW